MLDAKEVAKHNSRDSCWVIIHNNVYDVTDFLDEHPGGANIILRYGGKDATEEYDPVHPPGTLEEELKPSQILGPIDPSTLPTAQTSNTTTSAPAADQADDSTLPPIEQQLSIDDFTKTAQKVLSPKAWAYYSSASDDEITKVQNASIYQRVFLRSRIFRDVEHADTSTTLIGQKVDLPVFISPAAMARLAHPTGEAGIAQACGAQNIIQCVSNNASLKPEQISEARHTPSQPLWFQLYVQIDRKKSEAMLARINEPSLGYKAVVLTLDAPTPGKREADERVKNVGVPATSASSGLGAGAQASGGLGKALFAGTSPSLTWETLTWLRKHTHLPIILKGLQTHEDAALAASYGVAGILLSNHGGRASDTAPPPLLTLLEIRRHCPHVLTELEVYVDGGIRRGTDVLKALALGARAVGIGRPALYGLAGYGPEGVNRVIQIFREEIETGMRLLGVNRLEELGPHFVNTRRIDGWIWESKL
ncbi:FMN-dependent dehydrogenase-domain-containing protein [Geopyxis carbonaria]|nr:FMN-dependent dehydrogenase-domain-containing protein [Geopyxis carbonaria]